MIYAVRFKPGVTLNGLQPAGARILASLWKATQVFQRDLMVTCGTDSHGPDDPHTLGRALDMRTTDLPEAVIYALLPWLTKDLGPDFTVLYEVRDKPSGILAPVAWVNPLASGPHAHLQLRKGYGAYPPPADTTTVLTA